MMGLPGCGPPVRLQKINPDAGSLRAWEVFLSPLPALSNHLNSPVQPLGPEDSLCSRGTSRFSRPWQPINSSKSLVCFFLSKQRPSFLTGSLFGPPAPPLQRLTPGLNVSYGVHLLGKVFSFLSLVLLDFFVFTAL